MFCYFAIFQYNYFVKIKQRKDTMRNNNSCFILQINIQVIQYRFLSYSIYRTQTIIKNYNGRIFY